MKYLGASYYPESWGVERVTVDAKLMRDAGMNMVRLGEFAWCKMEPEEGKFDFSLFQQSLDIFAENEIKALMCTPTAAPPAWLTHHHPDTLVVGASGHRAIHGIRQQCCYNSKTFRHFCLRITDALTQALAGRKNIVAWQIDNELGQRLAGACSCEQCQQDFREFLKERHGDLDALNHAWKNEFWSHDYSDWDEILLAFPECLWGKDPRVIHHNYAVSRVLDSLRFYDKIIRDYAMAQVEVVKRNVPDAIITTNNPVGILDLKTMFADMDFASADMYWENRDRARLTERLTRYRSFKNKRFFIAETGLGYDYKALPSGQKAARVDMWRSFAHGADSYLIFRWRPPLGGQEQTALCPLSPAGEPRRTYQVAREMFQEAVAVRGALADISLPKAEVAILCDGDVHKSYLRHGFGRSINHEKIISQVFANLHARDIPVNIVSPEDSLDGYKLLVLPSQRIARTDVSAKIADFARNGGTVWAIGELNTADDNGNFTLNPCPEGLIDVFGIRIHTGASIPNSAKLNLSGPLGEGTMDGCWIADVENTNDAEALLSFVDGYYQGQIALTRRKHGEGRAYYQGVGDPGELLDKIAAEVIADSGVKPPFECPKGVEIIDCGSAVFILNGDDEPVEFTCPIKGEALIGDFNQKTGHVKLNDLDVCVIRKC